VQGITFAKLPAKGVTLDQSGTLSVAKDAPPGTATMEASVNGLTGTARLRIVPVPPYTDDFENAKLGPHPTEPGVQFAMPRPWWIGAGKKWEIRELDGNKVLARTLDEPLFQRTQSMIGSPLMSNYTMQVDILTEGNRRTMSSGGVIHQRYLIVLKGNHQELEVSSNVELLKSSVKFAWKPMTWYRLKTRVDNARSGGIIRAKVWQRDEPEPADWTIVVPHDFAHTHGSPGLYGFTPQSRFRVYLDNLSVTPND
jgi:hypothetical protein